MKKYFEFDSVRTSTLLLLVLLILLPLSAFSQAKIFPGADQRTPSRSEYFSWINNTNEGATAAQSMANLDFFGWLKQEYGMVLDIYAFDAGAIDGAGYYGSTESVRFRSQFPDGFGPLAERAGQMGTRLGLWGGPDGFGNTPEQELARTNLMVSLCRDYRFELFKFDAVCGDLRDEKQEAFIRMMTECRKFNPDLILLNHRLNLGEEGVKHATTLLLGGDETYIDVHMTNETTASHHRAGALSRDLAPGLHRLNEDHGVCISSCLDFWEDDLVLQAFNRNLILAPEIYGNPWLLRDDEYPKLARIFNLTRKYKNILVDGIVLPEDRYGEKAVSRGDGQTRLLTLRNLSWLPVTRTLSLDEEIGLEKGSIIELRQYHPVERVIGRFKKGQEVTVEVLPFRSCLLIASSVGIAGPAIEGCDYEVIQDVEGKPLLISLLGMPGEKTAIRLKGADKQLKKATLDGTPVDKLLQGKEVTVEFPGQPLSEPYHRLLGKPVSVPVPVDAEALYESTCFAADNNALEVRSLLRSGPTEIPVVEQAREAFFNQELFSARGLWDRYLFDGKLTTAFYPSRRRGNVDSRMNGGSLRLDLGKVTAIDSLRFLFGDEQGLQPFKSAEAQNIQVSIDLKSWKNIRVLAGPIMTLPLDPLAPIRYVRFSGSPERVIEIEGYRNGVMVDRSLWRASNLFSPYRSVVAKEAFEVAIRLGEIPKGSYLAIALNGRHGDEGAVAAIRVNGMPVGAPDRSPSYRCNSWEYPVRSKDSNYTYYVPLTPEMKGQKIEVVVLVMKNGVTEFKPEVWITAYPIPYEKITMELSGRN